MPVYDIAANRTYASPIRSYYQGKALRADTALREKQADALQMEIDSAPDRAAAAQRKEQRETEEHQWAREKAEEARVQAQREGWEHIYDATGKAAGVAVNGEYEDGGYEAFFQTLETLVEPEAAAAIREKVDPDGNRVFGPKELVEVNALAEVGGYGADVPSDYTLGKARYEGGTNKLIAGVAPTSGSDGSDVRSRKISDLAQMLDGDTETAIKIVDGHLDMKQNEKTGMIELMDKVTGEAWEVPLTYDDVPTAEPTPGKTLWDLAGHATGPISAIKAAGNIPAAWMGLRTASKVTQARQTFRTTGQNFIRALAINPRFPVGEQERIREEIALVPAVFDSPSLMRDRMISLSGDLQLRMDQALADSKNTRLPEDTRKAQASNANEIKNFLAVMGVPGNSTEIPDYVNEADHFLWPSATDDERKKMYPQYEGG